MSLLVPVITGIGLSTPLGSTVDLTWAALCRGAHVSDHARVPDLEVRNEPRVNALARRVARASVAQAGWTAQETRDAALVVGTSKGPVDAWMNDRLARRDFTGTSPLAFGLSETALSVATDIGCAGPRLTLSAACASGLHALIRAALMIRAGEVERAIVVAAESSLHPLFIASFRRLGVIAPEGHGCRPFDQTRAGFTIGEAAAAICLEGRRGGDAVGDHVAIERFALGADAAHLTGGDPAGATLRTLLARVIDNRPVDLVHAHGTGTIANDPVELAAIDASIADVGDDDATRTSLYSHKGAIGHTLGAAGLVAAVLNCMAHRIGFVPPNVRTRDPLAADHISIRPDLHQRTIRRSIALAAGFGGAIAAVSLVGRGN